MKKPMCATRQQFENAGIKMDRPVYVYRNLHRDCFSVMQGGLVKAHCCLIELDDCSFVVSQSGRSRVREQCRKEVHAKVKGIISPDTGKMDHQHNCRIKYNPYDDNTGFHVNGKRIDYAKQARLSIFRGNSCKDPQSQLCWIDSPISGDIV